MRVYECAKFIKIPADDGTEHHRRCLFFATFADKFFEIAAITGMRSGKSFRIVCFLIVMTELDEHKIAGLQRIENSLSAPLFDETFGAASVSRVIVNHYGFAEKSGHHLFPTTFEIVLRIWFDKHCGVANQPNIHRLLG